MARYEVKVHYKAQKTYVIEADSAEAAEHAAQELFWRTAVPSIHDGVRIDFVSAAKEKPQ